MKFEQNSVPMK